MSKMGLLGAVSGLAQGVGDATKTGWMYRARETRERRLAELEHDLKTGLQGSKPMAAYNPVSGQNEYRKSSELTGILPGGHRFGPERKSETLTPTARMKNAAALGLQPGSPEYERMIGTGSINSNIKAIDGVPAIVDPVTETFRPMSANEALMMREKALAQQLDSDEATQKEVGFWDKVMSYFGDDSATAGVSAGMLEEINTQPTLPTPGQSTTPQQQERKTRGIGQKVDAQALLQQARMAITRGADRAAVKQRLKEAGLKPGQIRLGLGKLGAE